MRVNEIDHNGIPNKPHLIYRNTVGVFFCWCDFVDVNNFHIILNKNIQTHFRAIHSRSKAKLKIPFNWTDHMKYFHTVYILECSLCRTKAISKTELNHEYTKHRCTERIVITVRQSTSCAWWLLLFSRIENESPILQIIYISGVNEIRNSPPKVLWMIWVACAGIREFKFQINLKFCSWCKCIKSIWNSNCCKIWLIHSLFGQLADVTQHFGLWWVYRWAWMMVFITSYALF